MTSLAGFEALLRGKARDNLRPALLCRLGPDGGRLPRAAADTPRSLDELVAAAMILYPRYLDPVSGLRCTPELLVERLASEGQRRRGARERLVRALQISTARALHFGHTVRQRARRST